jgi:hypothetical protein
MKHVLFIVGILLLFIPTSNDTPTPIPDPDIPPAPVVQDLWDIASDNYRVLTAEVFEELATKTFNNDDEKLKHILDHTTAARMGAFTEVNKRIQSAAKDNTFADLAKALKERGLK